MRGQFRSILQKATHTVTAHAKPKRANAFTKLSIVSIALITGSVMPIAVFPGVALADTDCSPNGVALAGSSWLGGTGVNVCNHPGDSSHYCLTISGDPTGSNCPAGQVWTGDKWQCVEMVNRLYLTKKWTNATWMGNGNTLVNNVPSGLIKQNNGSISYVNIGDVITLDDGGFGHAGIINSGSTTVNIINQNADLNSSASINSGSLSSGNAHYNMSGWFGYSVQAIVHHPTSPPPAHWIPLAGDWDGNGTVTIGLFNPNTNIFYLRNSNTAGNSDITVNFGNSGWVPIVGDWDGNGTTTIGVYNAGAFYLRNSNTAGNADLAFTYGNSGWTPLSGDWDGDHTTTIGVDDNASTFYLRNSNSSGNADLTFTYGNSIWAPVMGDWDGNGTTTVGVYDHSASTFYLRNSNSTGNADITVPYGNPN
jgi:hypothetical protein